MKYIDDPKLLNLRFNNGMLLLPYYHCRIMGWLNNPQANDVYDKNRHYLSKILSIIIGLFHISLKRRKIIGVSNAGLEHFNNGKWKNGLHGYYYDLYPRDFLMDETWDAHYRWKTFRSCDSFSTSIIIIIALSNFFSFFINKIKPIHSPDFDYMESSYPFITQKMLSYDSYFTSIFSFIFKAYLSYYKPRVLLLVCGSYGGVPGIMCKIARSKGVKVIDTQHGQVYQYKAYTASDIVRDSLEYQEYLPDYFYSFGNYWSNCVDWKYPKIAVGNPYLNEYVNIFSGIEDKVIDFLVISQPHSKDIQYSFVQALAKEFPSSKIVVRLHHREILDVEEQHFKSANNIEVVSSQNNLYLEMCSSKYVIGWSSTVLYELLAFDKQPIVVNDSISKGNFPENIGIWIDEPKAIRDINIRVNSSVNVDEYWHRDFEGTVKTHIDSLLNSK